jgi:hypothetical protein
MNYHQYQKSNGEAQTNYRNTSNIVAPHFSNTVDVGRLAIETQENSK